MGFLKETRGYPQLVETPVTDIHDCSNYRPQMPREDFEKEKLTQKIIGK
jgi:hypothetical protein